MKQHARTIIFATAMILVAPTLALAEAGGFAIDWHTIDGGGGRSTSGSFELVGTIGQPDAGRMSGGTFEVLGGFWAGVAPSGAGAPAATVTAAVSRKANVGGPGGLCDLALIPARKSDMRQSGITELRLTFDVPPGEPGGDPITLELATCAAPDFVPYSGASAVAASVVGNELVLAFTPALENARSYRITLGAEVTSIPGQTVELRGLIGDVNSDGFVNAVDRSVVVGAWTGGGFSCTTDTNSDSRTNATDRSIVVGSWTSAQNCAP